VLGLLAALGEEQPNVLGAVLGQARGKVLGAMLGLVLGVMFEDNKGADKGEELSVFEDNGGADEVEELAAGAFEDNKGAQMRVTCSAFHRVTKSHD
jgi:outer membrane lipoprotein SlyB